MVLQNVENNNGTTAAISVANLVENKCLKEKYNINT